MAEPSSKPGRQTKFRAPATLPTIIETLHNIRGSGGSFVDEKLGLGVDEEADIKSCLSSPVMPPPTYPGNRRFEGKGQAPRYSQIHYQMPPHEEQATNLHHLPYCHSPGRCPRPKKSLHERITGFFHRITEDQELALFPPQRRSSEHKDTGLRNDKRGQSSRRGGGPAFGYGIQSTPADVAENVMFLQAMHINGDQEVEHALAVDAGIQLYPQPQSHTSLEVPNTLKNHLSYRYQGSDEGEKSTQGQKGEERRRSVRISLQMLWRKKPKRRIVHNCDSKPLL